VEYGYRAKAGCPAAIGLAPAAEVAAAIKAADRAVSGVTDMEAGQLAADLEKAQGSAAHAG
jgi:hypothetical protein